MHTAHCARNITLCQTCKEPVPKNQYDDHKRTCNGATPRKNSIKSTISPPKTRISHNETKLNALSHIKKKEIVKSSVQESRSYKQESSSTFSSTAKQTVPVVQKEKPLTNGNVPTYSNGPSKLYAPKSGMLACKYCDLELPKLDLEEHENYCGARTDKCNVCGEIVMFKYKKIHEDSNHGFLKLNDGKYK